MRIALLVLLSVTLAGPLARAADPSPLATVLSDYWQDQLRHDPEMASALGDTRYDDQLSDYSAHGYNAAVDRGRAFIDRLSAIDTASLTESDKRQRDALVDCLVQQQAEADSKPWQMPITATSGLPLDLPLLAGELRFTTQQDYDRYVARLQLVPTAFAQITTDLMTGVDENRVLPEESIDKIITRVNAIATAKPEASIFAAPLKKFPAGIDAADKAGDHDRILDAIQRQVLPSYARLAKFLQTQYAPHAGSARASSSYNPEQHTVVAARAAADLVLGPRLDINAFRAEVEAHITEPPDTLAQIVEAWIAKQK